MAPGLRPTGPLSGVEKIAAAEVLLRSAVEPERRKLAGQLRALKRNLKLGPDGLRRVARRAHETRKQSRQALVVRVSYYRSSAVPHYSRQT